MQRRDYGHVADKLLSNGYQPIPIKPKNKRPAVPDWSAEVTPTKVTAWQAAYPQCGVGLLTANTPAIDIDVLDEAMSDRIEALCLRHLDGSELIRTGKAPKRLILCRTDAPYRKLRVDMIAPDGSRHAVEILGDGQQFVAFGIHPDTGKAYQWGMDDPIFTPAESLPDLSRDKAVALIDAISSMVIEAGWSIPGRMDDPFTGLGFDTDDGAFAAGKRPLDITEAEIDRYMASLPNEEAHYDEWMAVGMALYHQFSGSMDGFQRWVEWSGRSPKHDESEMLMKWDSFEAGNVANPVTFATVIKRSKQAESREATAAHKALLQTITEAQDIASLDDLTSRARNMGLSPIAVEDVANKLVKAYKRIGIDTTAPTVKRALKPRRMDKEAHVVDLEIALADKVLEEYFAGGRHLLYVSAEFWVYDNGVWRVTDTEWIKACVMDTLNTMKKSTDKTYQKLLTATVEAKRDERMSALVSSVTDIVKMRSTRDGHTDPLNLKGMLFRPVVNCQNGELWIEKDGRMRLIAHNPEHRLTTQVACDYDPAADCPLFKSALLKIFSECREPGEVMRHWCEVMGLIIQPVRAEAMWVLMKGPGGNGKSFLMEIISRLIGSCAYAGAITELSGRNGPNAHFSAGLVGKLMFLDDDLRTGTLLPDDWMKKLSEPKLMTANPKYGKTFEFMSRAIMVALSNHWPHTTDISMGMQRRAQVFEATYILPFEERDSSLAWRIEEQELPGVLNLLLSGLKRVLARGGRFDVPADCVEAKGKWLKDGNATARFLSECVRFEEGEPTRGFVEEPGGRLVGNIPAKQLYGVYKQWVYESGDNTKPLGRNSFYAALASEGIVARPVLGIQCYRGMIVLPPEDGAGGF